MSRQKKEFIDGLISSHRSSLERFLTRKLNNPDDAADVAQDAFLRLYRLDHPEQLDNARAFLFQVASNMAIDQLRRQTLHNRYLRSEQGTVDSESGAVGTEVSPEHIISAQETLAHIYQAVDSMPLKCRQAFLLHRTRGLSYSDIAQEMGVSVSSVEKYILQALKHCRAELVRYYSEAK